MAVIYGTKAADTKNGTRGNDTMYGWTKGGDASSPSGNDTLNGAGGNDKLYGGTGSDSLIGGAGLDTLDGGSGSDKLNGGSGNDTYIVDSTFVNTGSFVVVTDSITEAANSGTDTVQLTVRDVPDDNEFFDQYTYNLDNNLENLTLKGEDSGDIAVYANASDNIIFGGADNNYVVFGAYESIGGLSGGGGNDKLYGEAGYDLLVGNAGNDALIGGSGNDSLDGGVGTDTLSGGTGNDEYFFDSTADTITEYFNEGVDKVNSNFNYTLSEKSNLEDLELTGAAISGTGNTSDNTISGNYNNNYLYGGSGNDILGLLTNYKGKPIEEPGDDYLDGQAGNDTLRGGYDNDQLYGGSGNDSLDGDGEISEGNDSLYGGSGNDTLDGNVGNDYLAGDDGNDNLDGSLGSDTLTGGTGVDKFNFYQLDVYISGNEAIDTITDFVIADDTISVSAYFGGGLTTGAAITPEQFVLGSVAVDERDRFIYNRNTGVLFFDFDGTGATAQVHFATLTNKPPLTNADIFVV